MSNEMEKDVTNNAEFEQNDQVSESDAGKNSADTIVDVEIIDAKELQVSLTAAEAKAAENWAHFLAAKAEADNIRKRAERDVANAHKYALEKFIPELLAVKDAIELGTKAANDSQDEENNEQIAKFIEGSEMAITMFADTLKKVGVEMINPQGEVFNPELHQAMTMIPNSDVPANTIIEVIQKGYTLNERLLRPAMVIVSKAD